MHRFIGILAACLLSIALVGCSSDPVRAPNYEGKPVTIGIIGTPPAMRERNVNFEQIDFDQLEEVDSSSRYDAVFITEEHLSEAADSKYAPIYKTAGVPFFFIESKKSHLPFISEQRTYEEFPDMNTDAYVSGYFGDNRNSKYWSYGLQNDEPNRSDIEDVYTRIFETITHIEAEVNS